MRLLGLVVVLLSLPRAVFAQAEAGDLEEQEAQARFAAGEIAYAAGRYQDALNDFQRAYELSQRPELLFNIGLAADRLRQDTTAMDAFERFLEARPDHASADRARERLELLREQQDRSVQGTVEPQPRPPNVDPGPAESPSRAGPWVLGVTGGAMAVVGATLLAIALGNKSDVENLEVDTPWTDLEDQVDSVPRQSGAGIALISVGAAAALGAVLWRVMTPSEDVAVSVGPSGVQIRGQF